LYAGGVGECKLLNIVLIGGIKYISIYLSDGTSWIGGGRGGNGGVEMKFIIGNE
jgi:hypothetical protein